MRDRKRIVEDIYDHITYTKYINSGVQYTNYDELNKDESIKAIIEVLLDIRDLLENIKDKTILDKKEIK